MRFGRREKETLPKFGKRRNLWRIPWGESTKERESCKKILGIQERITIVSGYT